MIRTIFSSFLVFTLLSSTSYALETDQYVVWNSDLSLKDSTDPLNEYMNKTVSETLEKLNQNASNLSKDQCTVVTNKIIKAFQTITPPEDKIEQEMHTNEKIDLYPRVTSFSEYYKASIYRNILVIISKVFAFISPSIKINNVFIGIDKLGHFISQGKEYFDIYKIAIENEKNIYQAETIAINSGIQQEYGKYGLLLSGVFSFSDLEANYQGFKFSKNICYDSKEPYVVFNTEVNKWVQVRKIDMRKYVNPNWDESYNNSYFGSSSAPKIVPIIKTYCELYQSKKIQNLRAKYDEAKGMPSFSKIYLWKRMLEGSIINQSTYSIKTLCTETL